MATATADTRTAPWDSNNHDSTYIPRDPVTASLKFYDGPSDGSKPFNYPLGTEPPEEMPRRNFGDADVSVTIEDIRGKEALYNIDDNAFATLRAGLSPGVDFGSSDSIKEKYYPEVEGTLLKRFPHAKRVFVFDHTSRPSGGSRPPVLRTHIDQSKAAALAKARTILPNDADGLWKGRVRIINVWRPLNGPVQSFPLAFADSKTVKDQDLHMVEHRYADRIGETLSLAHADEQWHYWSGVDNDERLLIQYFDSEKGGRLAHTAFEDPRTPEGARHRESIEVRALIFG
ncbi:Aspirochlorine biosynthesis protein N [Lachnellula arida]|uniref:Aspirochlorine biosynthesis protein N n=1 Tax=Lachnellula arida TaxID=1316785 RepID=A0A8T9B768_9HELO|nr:Aspirochlorine biosynthesis protein N [Lachnellula arida]